MGDDQTKDDNIGLRLSTGGPEAVLTVRRDAPELDLRKRRIRSIDLTPLASCTGLQRLYLDGNELKHIDLSPLASCSGLQGLHLDTNMLGSIDLAPLSFHMCLRDLGLAMNRLQSIDLSPLSSCTRLQKLDLWHNHRLENIDLAPLASCTDLQELDLTGTDIEHLDLTPLASCAKLRKLAFDFTRIRRIDLRPLSSCTGLETLDLSSEESEDLRPLSFCPSLVRFGLSGKQMCDIDLTPLSYCNGLQGLSLVLDRLQSIDLGPLSRCTELRALVLLTPSLRNVDLSPLSSCTNLNQLAIEGSQLQRIDLTPLASCIGLRKLSLSETHLRSIDLTPLLSCTAMEDFDVTGDRLMGLRCALRAETLLLVAPSLAFERVRQKRPSRADLETLAGLVGTTWKSHDASKRWMAHAIVQDVLGAMGITWPGLLDADSSAVIAVLKNRRSEERSEGIARIVCQQIDGGGTTIDLDVEKMMEHGDLAARAQRVLELRKLEMGAVEVSVSPARRADLRPLWLTAYGHSVLSAMRLGTGCDDEEIEQVRDALSELGFSLRVSERETPITSNVSGPLREYIWRLADLRAEEQVSM